MLWKDQVLCVALASGEKVFSYISMSRNPNNLAYCVFAVTLEGGLTFYLFIYIPVLRSSARLFLLCPHEQRV